MSSGPREEHLGESKAPGTGVRSFASFPSVMSGKVNGEHNCEGRGR